MYSRWTSHLKDPLEKEELKKHIFSSKPILERLVTILTKELDSSVKEQRKIDHYNSPNWELIQVDCNATQRVLDKIIALCKV